MGTSPGEGERRHHMQPERGQGGRARRGERSRSARKTSRRTVVADVQSTVMRACSYARNLSFGIWWIVVAAFVAPIACSFSPDKSGTGGNGSTGTGNTTGRTIPGL